MTNVVHIWGAVFSIGEEDATRSGAKHWVAASAKLVGRFPIV